MYAKKDLKSLFDTLASFKLKKSKSNSERALLIEEFVTEINKERIGTKWKSVTGKVIAIKLAHIPTNDLYIFMSMCKDYKNRQGAFGKYFFGALKIK